MNYTQGKWRAEIGYADSFILCGGIGIATVHKADGGKAIANAHLIAAAPEIYEALWYMVNWYQEQGFSRELPEYRKGEEALVKAEGK